MSQPAIVLFGANGQLGSRLHGFLVDAGYEVTGVTRAACDFASADTKKIEVILRAVEPVMVINAAAYTKVDQAESEPELAHRINAELPWMIAQAASAHSIPSLYFSTDYVFDGAQGTAYREDAPMRPLGMYAKSKQAGEQAVRESGGHVFRLQWVYGGETPNFFKTMRGLLAEREELRVVADQLGSPSFAGHIAQAVVAAIPQILSKELPADIYHLTAQGHTSWHGFACAIGAGQHSLTRILPITTEQYPTPVARPKDTRLDCSKLAGYGIAMPHWRDGLAACINEWNQKR